MTVTVSAENAVLKSTKSKNSESSVHIRVGPHFQFEFVPRDTEKPEFFDWVDFVGGGCAAPAHSVTLALNACFMYKSSRDDDKHFL